VNTAADENETGREMSIRKVSVRAETRSIPRESGVVTYSFTWERFAAVDGGEIRIGDAVRGCFRSDDRGPGENGGGNETNASDETTTAGNETASGDAAVAPYRR
jgi:hypothetical protein